MSITYLGWYHVVLMQPPDRRVETVRRLRNVQTVTNASFGGVWFGTVVRSISRPCDVDRGGS